MPARREIDYWLAFSVFPGIGPIRFRRLIAHFTTPQKAWKASRIDLANAGLSSRLIDSFLEFRRKYDMDKYAGRLAKQHVSVLTLANSRYPPLLREISDAPFVLYVKGKKPKTPINLHRTIGVVGTRNSTPYGREVTARLVRDLVQEGFTIVSGLAIGIDTVAHETALKEGGSTIAVLGCGIDIVAPSVNARLYADIAGGGGAIVSEMPLGHRPDKGLFPARNRIISGLSLGVVVVEGAEDSGALITARNAAEQGRDVFAVPGPITSRYARGPARLLKEGARLVESVDDILDELHIERTDGIGSEKPKTGRTMEEQKILEALSAGSAHIDELMNATGLTMQVVGATITLLEMKGIVKDFGGKTYGLCS